MKKASVFEGKSSRELALEILLKVEKRNAYADILLDHVLKSVPVSAKERGLLTHLVYGTLRWRGRIDWCLSSYLHRPLSRLGPYLRNLLRLTVYQLLFLTKVPEYAAVNEGVELAKRHGAARAGALVNAVVRRLLREKDKMTYPDPERDIVRYLSVFWSHPDWLVKKWLDYFGAEETESLLKANNEESHLTLRTNRMKVTRSALIERLCESGDQALPTPWSPQGIRLEAALPVGELPGYQEGFFQVQGEASQLIGYLVDPRPGERILDACAAPGGKTTHLAELMEDRGEIMATDISARGLEKLKQNVQSLGLTAVRTVPADITKGLTGELALPYDRILLDAPCSGFGTLRSHPEAKWHRNEKDVERLSRLQKKMINQLFSYLKPGGILVYSTCTLTREENEGVVEDLVNRQRDLSLQSAESYLPSEARPLTCGKYLLALPHKHDTDGFFAARVRKGV